MQYLLLACVIVPLLFYSILLLKAEVKINCRSNLTINIVSRGKKKRKKWLAMPTLTKKNLFFYSNPSQFFVAEGAEADAHDWNQENCKGNILKYSHEKFIDFGGTCHGKSFFQLVTTFCWLQFSWGRYKLSK